MTARRLFFSRAGLALAALVLPALLAAGIVTPAAAQDASEFFLRLNRLENQVRELAGTVEKLEFENRRLQDQLKRFQEDVEFRFQESQGSSGQGAPARQKRSDLAPADPLADGAGAGQEITQTTTPAVPASSISAEAITADSASGSGTGLDGGERLAAQAPDAEDLGASGPGAVGPGASGPGAPAFGAAGSDVPVLAMPRIDTPAVTAIDEEPGAGRPLDLGAVAGAGRADPFQHPQSAPSVSVPSQAAVATVTGGAGAAGIPSVAATAPGDPQIGYRTAEASLRRQDYAAAEMGFREFLQSHPRDGLAPAATFHLAESYFFRGRYREAAEQYLRVTTTYAASPLAPAGMLKLGMSLEALGARDQACATFAETLRKFPAAGAEVLEGVARARARAKCA